METCIKNADCNIGVQNDIFLSTREAVGCKEESN